MAKWILVLVGWLYATLSYADLGPISVNSYLGQKLNATIQIRNLAADTDYSKLEIGLASGDKFKRYGLTFSPELGYLLFKVSQRNRYYYLQINSSRAINSPLLSFLLHYQHDKNDYYRQYTILLDPIDPAQPVTIAAASIRVDPVVIQAQNVWQVSAKSAEPTALVQSRNSANMVENVRPESVEPTLVDLKSSLAAAKLILLESESPSPSVATKIAAAQFSLTGVRAKLVSHNSWMIVVILSGVLLILIWQKRVSLKFIARRRSSGLSKKSTASIGDSQAFGAPPAADGAGLAGIEVAGTDASIGYLDSAEIKLSDALNSDEDLILSLEQILALDNSRNDIRFKLFELYLRAKQITRARVIYRQLASHLANDDKLWLNLQEVCHKYNFRLLVEFELDG